MNKILAISLALLLGAWSARDLPRIPAELSKKPTNVLATSPKLLKEMVIAQKRQSKCGLISDEMGASGMGSGLSNRTASSSTYLSQGDTDNGGRWYALFWSNSPEQPLCAYKVEPAEDGVELLFYGVRHSKAADAVLAAEKGNFFCKCQYLAR